MAYYTKDRLQKRGDDVYQAALDALRREYAKGPQDPEPPELYGRQWYSHIPQRFTAFAMPDPKNAESAIAALAAVALDLNPQVLRDDAARSLSTEIPKDAGALGIRDRIHIDNLIDTLVEYWHGDASDNFRRHYLYPLKYAGLLQGVVATALSLSLKAEVESRRAAHHDVWAIADKTIKALDTVGHTKTANAVAAFTVVEAVAAVVAAVPTGGASIAADTAAATAGSAAEAGVEAAQTTAASTAVDTAKKIGSAAKGLHSSVTGLDTSTKDLSGGTVNEVINNMVEALSKVVDTIDSTHSAIWKYLQAIDGIIDRLKPPRPGSLTNLEPTDDRTRKSTSVHILEDKFYGTL